MLFSQKLVDGLKDKSDSGIETNYKNKYQLFQIYAFYSIQNQVRWTLLMICIFGSIISTKPFIQITRRKSSIHLLQFQASQLNQPFPTPLIIEPNPTNSTTDQKLYNPISNVHNPKLSQIYPNIIQENLKNNQSNKRSLIYQHPYLQIFNLDPIILTTPNTILSHLINIINYTLIYTSPHFTINFMSSKPKLILKKKLKTSPKKNISTPKKQHHYKQSTPKQKTPSTASTKQNLVSTLKKILKSPSHIHQFSVQNRQSLISMLITQSSNVPFDSPLFSEADVQPSEDQELIQLLKNKQKFTLNQIKSKKDQAALKIQVTWRWYKTKKIVQQYVNRPPVSNHQVSIALEDDLLNAESVPKSNQEESFHSHSSSSKEIRLQRFNQSHPSVEVIRVNDLNQLLSSQVYLAKKRYQRQSYFVKQQLEMDIISESQYDEEMDGFKKIYHKKQRQLEQYSKLAVSVIKDVKKIIKQLMSDRNKLNKHKFRRNASNQQFVSSFNISHQIQAIFKKQEKQTIQFKQMIKDAFEQIQHKQFHEYHDELNSDFNINKKKSNDSSSSIQNQNQKEKSGTNKILVQQPAKVTSISVSSETVQTISKKILRFGLNSSQPIITNLSIPLGMKPIELLHAYHQTQQEIPNQTDVLPGTLFEDFQKIYLKQAEADALKEGKILSLEFKRYIHFQNEAIFDAINQGLQFQRKYGINGHPLPWKPHIQKFKPNIEKSLISVIDYVLDCDDCHCGYLSEHFYGMNPGLPAQLLAEVRSQKQLIAEMLQLRNEREDWNNYQINQTFLLLDIDTVITQFVFMEATDQFLHFLGKK